MKINIIYTNLKNGYLKIVDEKNLEISIPKRLKDDKIFLNKILQKAEKIKDKYSKKTKLLTVSDEYFYPYGVKTSISSYSGGVEAFLENDFFSDTKNYLEFYSTKLGLNYKSLKIKDLKSKWGSCSYYQDIVINLKLAFLPKEYLEYVCAHEITHLKHKNHSTDFYNELENMFPNYKLLRKNLKNTLI